MKQSLKPGIYLIIDPQMEQDLLLERLREACKQPITALQIWDHFKQNVDPGLLINKVLEALKHQNIPIIINNRWELLKDYPLHGVHFDQLPTDMQGIRQAISRPFISGLTCQNDLEIIRQAEREGMHYISFCSMFPSPTANSCERVDFQSVKAAAKLFSGQLFLAGGIRPDDLHTLNALPYDGIAIISGIMGSTQPANRIQEYLKNMPLNL